MKRLLCIILICVLCFAGCQEAAETKATQENDVRKTQPTPPEEKGWKPYDGETESYVYYYDNGLNRLWEEDLLFMADYYLQEHALLTPEESRVSYRDGVVWDGYYTDEMYNPEIRQAFLDTFNEIIPQLQDMNKAEFLMSAQKILAVLGDAHAYLHYSLDKCFPYLLFTCDNEFYVAATRKANEEILLSKLLSINGMPIADVCEALAPYIPHENTYWLNNCLARDGLLSQEMMKLAGVLDSDTVEFEFQKEDGTVVCKELTAVSSYMEDYMSYVNAYYDSPMNENQSQKFWFTYLDDVPYLRISSFDYDETDTVSLLNVGNELFATVRDAGGAEKLIVDLRDNGGGYQLQGYHQVVTVLQRMNVETIYVLINGGTFSQAVVFATYLKQELSNAILVGTPAGQSPNFYGAVEEHVMPNTETVFVLAWQWWKGWEGYEYDALMPDILVSHTLQDYKDGKDAVLEYLLKKEPDRKPRN